MKRILSVALAVLLAVVLTMPISTCESSAAFDERTKMPEYNSAEGKEYYFSDNNVFYKHDYGPNKKYLSRYGGYCIGNCTWYAYGRASEILGKPLNSNFRWGAANWWNLNKNGNYYPYGSKPKVGAIACYNNHVAIVEKVVNGKPYVSESGWTISKKCPKSASDLKFNYGSPWIKSAKGYIYILDKEELPTIDVDYSIKITADDLNMRTGPGTEYSRIGYVKKGTYKVSSECGDWAKLSDSGYWICLKYVTKVETKAEEISDSGEDANYKVKVSAINLNMRKGPGTSYNAVGYIKPGIYTINKTNNGWGRVGETGYWIFLKYSEKISDAQPNKEVAEDTSVTKYDVKINASSLNMRTGPGTSYSSKGEVKRGKTVEICDTKNGWGKLSSNGYWIKLSYTIPINSEYNVKVKAKDLNMRKGPGTVYAKKGYIKPGVHTIVATKNGWGKLKSNGYWIKLSYATKL